MRTSIYTTGQPGPWDRRRPTYLFSAPLRRGISGGDVVHFNKTRLGCANARNKGACGNKRTMRREVVTHVLGTICYLCLRAVH